MKTDTRIEFGDFQTPLPLAREVCARVKSLGVQADVVIEPTCGLGVFLLAAAESYPKAELRGFDIKSDYVEAAAKDLSDLRGGPPGCSSAAGLFYARLGPGNARGAWFHIDPWEPPLGDEPDRGQHQRHQRSRQRELPGLSWYRSADRQIKL